MCKVVRVGAKLSEKRARKKYPSRGTAGDAKGILLQVEQRQPDKMVDLVLRRSHSAETVVARPSEKKRTRNVPAGSHKEVVPEMRWAMTQVMTLSSRRKKV